LKKDKEECIIYNITMSNIYVDLTMSNLDLNRIPASFNERRNGNIIDTPSDYELSITRFQVTTSSLPVYIPIIKINSDDSNKTMLEVTMISNNFSVTTAIDWIPEIKNIAIPPPPSKSTSGLQSASEYYYAYSYSWLPFLVQKTLQKCFLDLQALDSSIAEAGKPFFYFDPLSGGCSILSCDSKFFNSYDEEGNNSTSNVKIFFNQPLYSLFSSFNSLYDGNLFQIIVDSNNFNYIKIKDIDYTKVLQEYSTVQNQNPVSSICFTSNNLPVIQENINSPILYVNGKSMNDQASNAKSKIVTDIQSSSLSYKPLLTMIPSAEFRMISMHQSDAINELQISIYWRDKIGQFNQLYLPPGGTASLKIFFKKIK
jgi:hypothetical protein